MFRVEGDRPVAEKKPRKSLAGGGKDDIMIQSVSAEAASTHTVQVGDSILESCAV